MSKYRIELQASRLLIVFQLLTYFVLVLSVLVWKVNVVPYQWVIQGLFIVVLVFLCLKTTYRSASLVLPSIICSEQGEWLEVLGGKQSSWQVTDKSRCMSLLLFVHLVSPLDKNINKWTLVFKDQVSEQNFRRFCRMIIFQQQIKNT